MSLPLADRDLYLIQIEEEIRNKKKLLVKKKKDLDKKYKLNQYLSEVKNDYSKYYDYILNEKQQQHNALILLKEYIDDLMKTENLVDDQLRSAKHDQKDIIREIDNVKAELDELID
jgi:ribosome biogenesis GTPase A